MSDHLQSESFSANKVVIREGDVGDKFYLIREGEVLVRSGDKELARLTAGGFFGEMALLTGQPRNATVETVTDSILYSLSKDQFKLAIEKQASFEAEIRTSLFDRQ